MNFSTFLIALFLAVQLAVLPAPCLAAISNAEKISQLIQIRDGLTQKQLELLGPIFDAEIQRLSTPPTGRAGAGAVTLNPQSGLAAGMAPESSPLTAPAATLPPLVPVSAGKLGIDPLPPKACLGAAGAESGQSVQLSGDGFMPGSTVALRLRCCDFELATLGSAVADGGGAFTTTVVVPIITGAGQLAAFEAAGADPSGLRLAVGYVLVGPAFAPNSDNDWNPNFCDNCPSTPNNDQADADHDGLGDACDDCPLDSLNDPDGDEECSDADTCPGDPLNDQDGDGWCADDDNCPTTSNPDQMDLDRNGIGDACQNNMATCSDGIDNDSDGRPDYPADPGCSSPTDTTETDAALPCDDGLDNDADGLIDRYFGDYGDPGCGFGGAANSESPACDNGIDDDGDGYIDWDGDFLRSAPDPECLGIGSSTSEAVPEPSASSGLFGGALLLAALAKRKARQNRATRPSAERPPTSRTYRTL